MSEKLFGPDDDQILVMLEDEMICYPAGEIARHIVNITRKHGLL